MNPSCWREERGHGRVLLKSRILHLVLAALMVHRAADARVLVQWATDSLRHRHVALQLVLSAWCLVFLLGRGQRRASPTPRK